MTIVVRMIKADLPGGLARIVSKLKLPELDIALFRNIPKTYL